VLGRLACATQQPAYCGPSMDLAESKRTSKPRHPVFLIHKRCLTEPKESGVLGNPIGWTASYAPGRRLKARSIGENSTFYSDNPD
jgi:hypothetical protein